LTETVYEDKMLLYRAVGGKEFYSILQTRTFTCLPGGVGVKYFGKNFDDTLKFADMIINRNVVAVIEVEVPEKIIMRIGDFVDVDPFLFKHGTVEIWEADLNEFNAAIIRIVHKF
jgi:hypothetical protein